MDETIKEQRLNPRKQLEADARVCLSENGEDIGQLSDVSSTGFKLHTHRAVKPSETFEFDLSLPPQYPGVRTIRLQAECVWCQPTVEDTEKFAAGFQLIEIEEQDSVALKYFIRDY
ncbi:PilZ domain-containing protein [Endozoicomonadaceae bacterium StTr2]